MNLYGENIKYSVVLYSSKYSEILERFNCGNDEIDKYIKEKAFNDLYNGNGVTSLFLNENKERVIGFYTLCCSSMIVGTGMNDNHFYPAVELKMFAVDREYQNIPYSTHFDDGVLSDYLLSDIVDDISSFSKRTCGTKYITLYAVPSSIDFYERNDFKRFGKFMRRNTDRYLEGCEPMYLPLI